VALNPERESVVNAILNSNDKARIAA
jgi:hypothetical protein